MTQQFSRLPSPGSCLLTLILFYPGATQAREITPAKSWPSIFKLQRPATVKLIQKGTNDRPFIYRTKHFELRSPAALSQHNLSHFATTAESVPRVLAHMPLPLLSMPGGTAKVIICPDEISFLKSGGTPGAAGIYSGRKQAILLRADTYLNPPRPDDSKLPPKANHDLLVHEFTHLCMHQWLAKLPVWFTEGTAEYLAAAHQNKGTYQFSNICTTISRHIKRNLPLDKDTITLPNIKETLNHTRKSWRDRIKNGDPTDHYRSYATSLLLVHTLFHGGQNRRDATSNFLTHIQKHYPRPPIKIQQFAAAQSSTLFPPLKHQQLQQRIVRYWRPHGLHIKFRTTPASIAPPP